MDDGDRLAVSALLNESPDALRDDFMVSLVAEYGGRLVAILRGWLGHPHGHIEVFTVDDTASRKARYLSGTRLLLAFEGLLESVGASGWTAMTAAVNEIMVKFLTLKGAQPLPGEHLVFVRRWR